MQLHFHLTQTLYVRFMNTVGVLVLHHLSEEFSSIPCVCGCGCCGHVIVLCFQIPVAVKTIFNHRKGPSVETMFLKEAESMMRLHHPHIIKLHGIVLGSPLMLVCVYRSNLFCRTCHIRSHNYYRYKNLLLLVIWRGFCRPAVTR